MLTGKSFLLGALVICAAFVLSACSPKQTQTPTNAPSSKSQDLTVQASTSNKIEIKNFAFSPASTTVKPGQTVEVTNQDSIKHNVVSDDGSSFKTDLLEQGEYATFIAPTTPGTYAYHCGPHPNMKGILIVQ